MQTVDIKDTQKCVKFRELAEGQIFRFPGGAMAYIKGFDGILNDYYNTTAISPECESVDVNPDTIVEPAKHVEVTF